MNSAVKNIIFWVVMVVTALLLWAVVRSSTGEHVAEYSFTQFTNEVNQSNVKDVTIAGTDVTGNLRKDNAKFKTTIPANYPDLYKSLLDKGVSVSMKSDSASPWLSWIGNGLLPILVLVGFWIFFFRQMQSGGNKALSFGKSRARLLSSQQKKVTFKDVAGVEEAKEELQEIIEFLREPQKFQKLGGRIPKGVLLVGPPGTGKTLLARAIAGEANVPFFSISGSDFVEMFVGVGASRVRDLFEQGKKNAPCIIFIDEIDAVGRHRGAGLGGGHDEREQTLNQLLSEMDGFSRNDLTIVLAATNRPDVLDPALLRPGRFDRRVIIDRPELGARRAILDVHTRGKPLAPDLDLDEIAGNTPGFSGADLANLANEAALNATRRGAEAIGMGDFMSAYDKIVLGDPRETKLDPAEKRRIAVHESGHAVVAHFSPNAEPPQRVSIIPRGMALGVTQQSPGGDRHIYTEPQLADNLRVMLGGHAAERVVLGDTSSGAENDLKRASDLAFKMVAHWGMSEKIGPVYHEHRTEHPFLGQVLATEGATSDATVHLIESETRRVLTEAREAALKVVRDHRDAVDRLVNVLLERETIEKDELGRLLGPGAVRTRYEEAPALH